MHLAAIRASMDAKALNILEDLYEAAEDRPEYQNLANDLILTLGQAAQDATESA